MVDELGGIDKAIALAAERAGLEDFGTVVLPGETFNPLQGLNLGLPFGETPVKSAGGAALLEILPAARPRGVGAKCSR